MKKHLWKLMGLTVLLALLVGATSAVAQEDEPAGPVNRLRVYGEEGHATFPYTRFDGPFNIGEDNDEKPHKDFVQFNPAILFDAQYRPERDEFLNGDPLAPDIICNDKDAAEKVHARMWYEPDLCEPLGVTSPEVGALEKPCGDHIVFEYTYTMLDDINLDPVACVECQSQMVFPMAGLGGQLGLDRYDVGPYEGINDPVEPASDEVMKIERIQGVPGTNSTNSTIVVSAETTSGGALRVEEGQWIEFFDYALLVTDAPTTNELKVEVAVYYTGYKQGYVGIENYVGRTSLWMGDTAAVDARKGPIRLSRSPEFWRAPQPVTRPFFFKAEYVGTDRVTIKPYRYFTTGESFFVDGAEYAVSAIFTEDTGNTTVYLKPVFLEDVSGTSGDYVYVSQKNADDSYFADCSGDGMVNYKDVMVLVNGVEVVVDSIDTTTGKVTLKNKVDKNDEVLINYCHTDSKAEYALKYISLRNPLPKGDDEVLVPTMTVYKTEVAKDTSLPMLPPFNMEHDEVDDVNIPEWLQGHPNRTVYPDEQLPDNVIDEAETCGPLVAGAQFGCTSYIHAYFNTLWERILQDMPPYDGMAGDPESFIAWTEETDEERFDTNLLEEKFTEPDEKWQWINIETNPMDYTEFILPERRDRPAEVAGAAGLSLGFYETGDYILVSSWKTQEDKRVKFAYDAAVGPVHSADLYINDAEYNEAFFGEDFPAVVGQNSLRAYGRCVENAAFPYTRFDGPFNIGNANMEKPLKDFIVHNPAFLDHLDGGLYSRIAADGNANQKVHLRTWYVPKYDEPAGYTEPMVAPVSNDEVYGHGDIVNEYTYLLLDDATNDPTHGKYETTRMIFPMAGLGEQVGLDRYDVNGDESPEAMSIEGIYDSRGGVFPAGTPYCSGPTTKGTVIVSPQEINATEFRLQVGQTIEFFDYAVTLADISSMETKAEFDVSYLGREYDVMDTFDSIWLLSTPFGVNNTAIVQAGKSPDVYGTSWWTGHFDDIAWTELVPVKQPFGFRVDHISDDYVTIKPFRMLTAGESFFVDGAEYDVAAIGVVPGDTASEAHGANLCELKYITLRNPLPKCDPTAGDACADLLIPGLTVYKTRFGPAEVLPVLPPFNHDHEIVDDVNIPECINSLLPDEQYRDNVPGTCSGAQTLLQPAYDTIAERIVDAEAFEFWWLAEEKEPRFDTNLLEEKFTIVPDGYYVPKNPVMDEVLEPYKAYDEGFVYGPVDVPNFGGNDFFADCDANGVVDEYDVEVYVDGVRVPVVHLSQNGYVRLEEDFGPYAEVTINYCYEGEPIYVPSKELWEWINIETLPWDYTEFVLPEIPDVTGTGDYILVSSFTTQDDSPDGGPVRVKFTYDPSDGTGLYVNSDLCEPARVTSLTSNSPVDQYGMVELQGAVNDATDSWTWDFGDLTGCTGEETASPTCDADEPGTYEVCLTAENDCPSSHTECIDVVVEACPGDFVEDGFRDLSDIMAMLPAWNTTCDDDAYQDIFDFNNDCEITLFDLMQVVNVWNTPCPGGMP